MPKVQTKVTLVSGPWWLDEGDLECPYCGQLYILELEFRCPECDSPSCRHCRTKHAEGHDVCPECVDSTHE